MLLREALDTSRDTAGGTPRAFKRGQMGQQVTTHQVRDLDSQTQLPKQVMGEARPEGGSHGKHPRVLFLCDWSC